MVTIDTKLNVLPHKMSFKGWVNERGNEAVDIVCSKSDVRYLEGRTFSWTVPLLFPFSHFLFAPTFSLFVRVKKVWKTVRKVLADAPSTLKQGRRQWIPRITWVPFLSHFIQRVLDRILIGIFLKSYRAEWRTGMRMKKGRDARRIQAREDSISKRLIVRHWSSWCFLKQSKVYCCYCFKKQ